MARIFKRKVAVETPVEEAVEVAVNEEVEVVETAVEAVASVVAEEPADVVVLNGVKYRKVLTRHQNGDVTTSLETL